MLRLVSRSLRAKLMLVVLATTFAALLITGTVLVIYDLRTHQASWVEDLVTQADIVGRASAPSLTFGDTLSAHQNLALLALRPQIVQAAIYGLDGAPFASYSRDPGAHRFPAQPEPDGHRFERNDLVLFRSVADADEHLGTVYVLARYELMSRLWTYLAIVGIVLFASLLIALLMSFRLQSAVTEPILAIADVAHRVKARRDFSLRVEKTTEDETGYLVDAFNDMLVEVGDRTEALEGTNRILQHEMEVRQEAEQALLLANQRKDEFLATLAHELRNPLGPIRNAVHYLGMKGTPPDVERSLALIDRQVQHMVRLIEDLLDISRITRDALELRVSSFVLGDLMQDVVDSCQHAVDEAKHHIEVRNDMPGATLRADRARLAQAVCNIVHNAVKYTPPGGHIRVAAMVEGHDLDVTVADDGIGIPPDKLSDIFQPFSQLDRSLEKTRGGLGIGLALAQRLVALHGGTVTAHSEGPGHGSEFHIRLPIVTSPSADGSPDGKAPDEVGEGQSILVADDNHDAAESLALLLRAAGYRTDTARDGVAALALAERTRYDAIIIDIGMPRMNGYDLARHIRDEPWGRAPMLIALTGWGQLEDKERAFDAGFDDHLTKPAPPEQILGVLARLRPGETPRAPEVRAAEPRSPEPRSQEQR